MTIKPVKFEQYMHKFDNHKVVMKGQTASGINFKLTNAAVKAPLQKAKSITGTLDLKLGAGLPIEENYFGNHVEIAEKVVVTHSLNADGDFESPFEYFVDDQGVVMIKCNGQTVGPAVSLDWEKEVEEDELDTG